MIKAILGGILKMVTKLINLFLLPINLIFNGIFPDLSNGINTFIAFVNTYFNVGGLLTYFFSLFPPIFRTMLITWFTFVIAYYGMYYTYQASIKIFGIIRKLKFW